MVGFPPNPSRSGPRVATVRRRRRHDGRDGRDGRDTPPRDRGPDGADRLSDQLEAQLDEPEATVGSLTDALDERGFAVVLMIVMIPSALPIPTGGVTHVLEVFGALIAIQMIFRRRALWIPARLARAELGATFTGKAAPKMLRFIRWFERRTRPRLPRLVESPTIEVVLGIVLLVFVVGAFVAPPFSGLDTLPSLGVVVICLGLVLSDGLVVIGGLVVGVFGLALEVALGAELWSIV